MGERNKCVVQYGVDEHNTNDMRISPGIRCVLRSRPEKIKYNGLAMAIFIYKHCGGGGGGDCVYYTSLWAYGIISRGGDR